MTCGEIVRDVRDAVRALLSNLENLRLSKAVWGFISNDDLFSRYFQKARTYSLINFTLVDGRFHFPHVGKPRLSGFCVW